MKIIINSKMWNVASKQTVDQYFGNRENLKTRAKSSGIVQVLHVVRDNGKKQYTAYLFDNGRTTFAQ